MAVLKSIYEDPEDYMSYGIKDVLSFFTDSAPLRKLKKISKEDPANLSLENLPKNLSEEDVEKFYDWVDTQPQQDLESFFGWLEAQEESPEIAPLRKARQTPPEEGDGEFPAPDLDQEVSSQEMVSSIPPAQQEGEDSDFTPTPAQEKLFDLFQSKQPKATQEEERPDKLFVPDSPLINGSLKDYASYFLYSLLTGKRIDPDVWMKHSRGIKDVVVSAEDPKYDIKMFLKELNDGMRELMQEAGVSVPIPEEEGISTTDSSIDVSDELLDQESDSEEEGEEDTTPATDLDQEPVSEEVEESDSEEEGKEDTTPATDLDQEPVSEEVEEATPAEQEEEEEKLKSD